MEGKVEREEKCIRMLGEEWQDTKQGNVEDHRWKNKLP